LNSSILKTRDSTAFALRILTSFFMPHIAVMAT
jgi:hypothetical protein